MLLLQTYSIQMSLQVTNLHRLPQLQLAQQFKESRHFKLPKKYLR